MGGHTQFGEFIDILCDSIYYLFLLAHRLIFCISCNHSF